MSNTLPYVPRGKRTLLVGRTGSGKTSLARWLINRSPGAWLVLNPKYTSGFRNMADSTTIRSLDIEELARQFETKRIVIVEPPEGSNDPQILDDYIEAVRKSFDNLGLYIDELVMVHRNNQCGDGLKHWLTLGREANLSFIGSTQRPRRISLFCFSESDYFSMMQLNLADDRKRVYEFVGNPKVLVNPPLHYWRWYDVNGDRLQTYKPVPI